MCKSGNSEGVSLPAVLLVSRFIHMVNIVKKNASFSSKKHWVRVHFLPMSGWILKQDVRKNNRAASLIQFSDTSNSLLTRALTLENGTENTTAPLVCMCVLFLIPQCEITSRPTGRNRLRVQRCKLVSLIFPWSARPATIRAASRTTTASLCSFTWVQSCIKAWIRERNENWHHPDYNYLALSTSACSALLWVREAFLLLDAALLRVQMDSEHIWSGNWPSVWETRAQQNWQNDLALLSGAPPNFYWPDLTALRWLAKRFL